MMRNRYLELTLILVTITFYVFIFHVFLTKIKILDFTSFYLSLLNLTTDKNPYGDLFTSFFPSIRQIANNLNPPFFLFLFNPLIKFNYYTALFLWILLSFILGLIGSFISFYHVFSIEFLRKYWLLLGSIYLSFYATLINITSAQIGLFLFFLIMVGYHFYLKKSDYLAGIFWGSIISLKFFPALLFFYAFQQRRMKVFLVMIATFLLTCLVPLFIYGTTIYTQYFSMIMKVFWYGDNWNASLYGYLYRLFIDPTNPQNLLTLKACYAILFFLFLFYTMIKLGPVCEEKVNHQPFCLTLAMMLFISPFGWLYYFPVIIFPLALTWAMAMKESTSSNKMIILWLCCFMLINSPQGLYPFGAYADSFFAIFYTLYTFLRFIVVNLFDSQ